MLYKLTASFRGKPCTITFDADTKILRADVKGLPVDMAYTPLDKKKLVVEGSEIVWGRRRFAIGDNQRDAAIEIVGVANSAVQEASVAGGGQAAGQLLPRDPATAAAMTARLAGLLVVAAIVLGGAAIVGALVFAFNTAEGSNVAVGLSLAAASALQMLLVVTFASYVRLRSLTMIDALIEPPSSR